MRKRLALSLLSAAVVSVVSVVAAFPQPPPGTDRIDEAVVADAAQSAPPPATTLRVRGTIDNYDPSTRVLSLSTSNGPVQLQLASTVRIREGWHSIPVVELKKRTGYPAAIRYSESGGNKTVESVHVFGKKERIER